VRLFHYHLVTSKVRQAEARYLAKLGFELVARYGRVGEDQTAMEPGVSWEELDQMGFRLRLSELQRGAVNVVLQPGHWELPRVDHLGLVLDEDDFTDVLARANAFGLKVQEHPGRRAFVATNAGYRLEVHPPREWIDDLLADEGALRLEELQMRADDPAAKAAALRDTLGISVVDGEVEIGGTVVRFLPGGPQGRPELHGERFV
jgi:catechol 2,3-dioxygenase-like lactoylglutathione lyase family enzyme